jgi:hypothetical protein
MNRDFHPEWLQIMSYLNLTVGGPKLFADHAEVEAAERDLDTLYPHAARNSSES